MVHLVAPGGTLMVRDLARPDSHDEVTRLGDLYAGGESPEAKALFLASLTQCSRSTRSAPRSPSLVSSPETP